MVLFTPYTLSLVPSGEVKPSDQIPPTPPGTPPRGDFNQELSLMTSEVGEAEQVEKESVDLGRSEEGGKEGGKEVGGSVGQPVVCGSPDLAPGGRSDEGVLRDPPQGWKEEKVVLPPGTDKTGPDFRPVTVISPDMLAALAAAGEESEKGEEEGLPTIASSVEGAVGDEAAGGSDPSLEGWRGEGGEVRSLEGKRGKAIPKPSHRTYIPTPVGVRLVTSGYSGVHEQLRKLPFGGGGEWCHCQQREHGVVGRFGVGEEQLSR